MLDLKLGGYLEAAVYRNDFMLIERDYLNNLGVYSEAAAIILSSSSYPLKMSLLTLSVFGSKALNKQL